MTNRILVTAAQTVAMLLFSAFSLLSQMPRTISYQGVLADQAGNFLPDGIHAVSLSLYDAPSGGASLFTEATTVTLVRGVFNVIIGATGGGIPESVAFDRAYFLGVSVDGGAELQPRTPMTSVPYAMQAAYAERSGSLAPGATGAVTSINGAEGPVVLQGADGTSVSTDSGVVTIASSSRPSGRAGGDLTGTYPQPMIAIGAVSGDKIADRGVSSSKINGSGADTGDVLRFDGRSVKWGPDGLQLPFHATTTAIESAIQIRDKAKPGPPGIGNAPLLDLEALDSLSGRVPIRAISWGQGASAIFAQTFGGGSVAVFQKERDRLVVPWNYTIADPVLVARSFEGSTATAAKFVALDRGNTKPAVEIEHHGVGDGVAVMSGGRNIAIFRHLHRQPDQSSYTKPTVARIDSNGRGFFDGGTQNSGADLAEMFDVAGDRDSYAPGEVLVIDVEATRRVTRSTTPYSTLVAGVYATKPGVVLTEASGDEDISQMVPMGVIGVIPTKVTGENGSIQVGDLVVTSSVAGHAMKGDPAVAMMHPGCVIGKALENFDGSGAGMIRVLVNNR